MWIHPPGSTYTNVQAAGAAGHCYRWNMELDRDDIRQGIEGNRMDRRKGAGHSRSRKIGPIGVPKSPKRAGLHKKGAGAGASRSHEISPVGAQKSPKQAGVLADTEACARPTQEALEGISVLQGTPIPNTDTNAVLQELCMHDAELQHEVLLIADLKVHFQAHMSAELLALNLRVQDLCPHAAAGGGSGVRPTFADEYGLRTAEDCVSGARLGYMHILHPCPYPWSPRKRMTTSLCGGCCIQMYCSFMDEEYYDWELEESASEGEGSGDDGAALAALPAAAAPAPVPAPAARGCTCPSAEAPLYGHFDCAGGGRGMRVGDACRPDKAAWHEGGVGEEGDMMSVNGSGVARGMLEQRQPQLRLRPHLMYLAMVCTVEGGYDHSSGNGGASGSGSRAEEDLPLLSHLRKPGEPAMLLMRGLRNPVQSLCGRKRTRGTAIGNTVHLHRHPVRAHKFRVVGRPACTKPSG
ncbi:hypothetical protein B0H17DRAFT_1149889 [Mycena rosella]|uniref:Uncharacterized protein n=1 Tax=Mycena rosella TaxID=1033263 RepID=A0AAD7BXY2_MYCRO|nr:hypothetical protein B0H17DRAFT_1149889 [Mycena rosella]